jgi:hypothetical protein
MRLAPLTKRAPSAEKASPFSTLQEDRPVSSHRHLLATRSPTAIEEAKSGSGHRIGQRAAVQYLSESTGAPR